MKLSKTSTHAALAVAYLAERGNGRHVQARQVAEHLGIPTDSALKILQAMVRGQIVQSQLGRSGGYLLARPADQITLLQIVEAIDGPMTSDGPIYHHPRLESRVAMLRSVCERATHQARQELERHTGADLAVVTGDPTSGLAAAS